MQKLHANKYFNQLSLGRIPVNLLRINLLLVLMNAKVLNGLKCVCDIKDCDVIGQNDCPGALTYDACNCCKVCAKVEGETCGGLGGFSGSCQPPMKCITKPPIIGTGICLKLPSDQTEYKYRGKKQKCKEVVIQPGCEIVERKCQCWYQPIKVCKGNLRAWDFANKEECELNLENLIQSEMEFDEDYTAAPRYFEITKSKRKKRIKPGDRHRFSER